ncbi:MAG: hypothetical protein ABEH77_09735, partial [Halobacteriaceae archaeon]
MARCAFESRDGRRCPRPAHDGADRCAFHLSPAEREERGVGAAELRAAFRADVAAGEERREYVGVEAEALELGSLLVDGDDVGHIVFRDARVGEFDLSGSVVRHPLVFEDCEVGSLDATGATFGDRVRLAGSVLGDDGPTCLRCRRTAFEAGLEVSDTVFRASVELPACRVEGWLDFDGARVEGRAHFPNATLGRAQFVDT